MINWISKTTALTIFSLLFFVFFANPAVAAKKPEKEPRKVASTEPVYVLARLHFRWVARPVAELFSSLAKGLPKDVKSEDGCQEYRFYRSKKNPLDFLSIEKWASEDQFDKHMKTVKMKGFVLVMSPFMTAKPEMILHQPISGQTSGITDDDSLKDAMVVVRRIRPKSGISLIGKLTEIQTLAQNQGAALQFNIFKGVTTYPKGEEPSQFNAVEFWKDTESLTAFEKESPYSAINEQIEPTTDLEMYEPLN
jgi:quinol monooxygenase YgiN